MTVAGWLAAIILFLNLPIPIYWYVVHPLVSFWRRHKKAAYITGLLCSWPPVTAGMIAFRRELFRSDWPSAGATAAGLTLIIFEGWIFWRVRCDLGGARLVGKTELTGAGQIAHQGIYARMRHPRYTGSFLAILGACFLAAKCAMWITAGVWSLMILVAIALEERELRARFGTAYEEYRRKVPRFFPALNKPAAR